MGRKESLTDGMGIGNREGKEVEMMKLAAIAASAALSLSFAALDRGAAEAQAPVIVALGDSLTAGLGLPQDQAFPAQLEAALKARGIAARVVDAGVSGDTAAAGLARLDWALAHDASAVIIELGANDALQGLPPEGTKAALTAIIEKVQARGLPILLAGMEAPRNMGKEYVEAFGAIYTDLAARYDLILYPFFLEGAALNQSLMQADGLHPNAKGVAAIVANILPKVEELLARVKNQG
jgi:acyl-CoA thioesterase-1